MKQKGFVGILSAFVITIIIVAAGFGFLLIGGFDFPKYEYQEDSNGGYIPVITEDKSGDNSLQLKTLKFKSCSSTAALNFLLDRSGSMTGNKIAKLKSGMLSFANKLSDESIIGIQDFSSPEHPSGILVKVLVPFNYYKNVKNDLPSLVNGLRAGGNTNMKSALSFTKERIKEGQAKFPDRKFAFLFLSDGAPVPADSQTPDDNLINELKKLDIRIFTIAYGSSAEGVRPLMKKIATSAEDAYYVPNEDQIEKILNEIAVKICQ